MLMWKIADGNIAMVQAITLIQEEEACMTSHFKLNIVVQALSKQSIY